LSLSDTVIVEAPDAVLVTRKGSTNKVKDVVNILSRKGRRQVQESTTVWRPWGYYTILKETPYYKVKEIGIYPKKYISLQKHKFRSEHWNVVEGLVRIMLGRKEITLKRNESIFVPKGEKHRLFNPTKRMAKIVEVQIGRYLGEDDIRRFDTY
jgi:mannose-1-phosphate guanylyltransferase/mannose-6-phosphate isomerase